ncbi:MAG: hypothetical protein E7C13_07645 [Actinomyces sp.]|nr:hypothetical protein [Actinomyces sp.]
MPAGLLRAISAVPVERVRPPDVDLRESHPHDVQMTTEAPNYHSSSAR